MDKIHNRLSNDKNINYYEIDNQNLEVIGNYYEILNDINYVSMERTDYVNQKIDNNTYVTPIKTMQIDYNTMIEMGINNSLSDGAFFEKDFTINDQLIIPIIVGNNYSKRLKVGDTFNACYLGNNNITCKVIGILNYGYAPTNIFTKIFQSILEDNQFDNYIIMPNLLVDFTTEQSNYFREIVNCQKCEGFILIDSVKKFNYLIDVINELSNSTGYKFEKDTFEPIYKQIGLNYFQVISVLCFCLLLLLITLIKIVGYHKKRISEYEYTSFKRFIPYIISFQVNEIINFAIIFGISFFITSNVLVEGFLNKLRIVIVYVSLLFLFVYILFVIIESIYLIVFMKLENNK